ncbi:MAG: NnrS family protein [Burkholderiales bacterium]
MIGAIRAAPRPQPVAGSAFFRQGFRPFFLGAGVWALAATAIWLSAFQGLVSIPTAFNPLAWHAHEMLFGFVAAAIAGFLLTAVPNWTGRTPIQGLPLAVLFALWLIGRAAAIASGLIGAGVAAALDLSFLALLLGVVLRELVAARNWRNLPITIALAGLLLANVLIHAEAAGYASTGAAGQRLGIAVVVLLISLVGGRIIPSFTGNWLKKRGEARMPAGHDAFDLVALAILLIALAAWVAAPQSPVTGASLIGAGVLALIRLARWRGHRTLSEPLLWSLHLGFAWVPTGLLLAGASLLLPSLPATAGIHALTAGAMGSMTLAVMTRATLGHTGRALTADRWTAAIYLLVTAAAALRVAAPLLAEAYLPLLWASAVAWIAAFGIFAVRFGRLLVTSESRA